MINELPGGYVCWDRLLFSAKECVYKAWFPLERSWLAFEDARILISPENMAFVACILRPALHPAFRSPLAGKFIIAGDLIVSSLIVPAETPSPSAPGA